MQFVILSHEVFFLENSSILLNVKKKSLFLVLQFNISNRNLLYCTLLVYTALVFYFRLDYLISFQIRLFNFIFRILDKILELNLINVK